jgi:hypothetical protein
MLMGSMLTRLLVLSALLAGTIWAGASAVQSTFTFTGTCAVTDLCTGVGTGILVLDGYTLGGPLEAIDFVSFTYSSSVYTTPVTILEAQLTDFSGEIANNLPAAENVEIAESGLVFLSSTAGTWCFQCSSDQGNVSVWQAGAAPEPADFGLVGTGVLGLAFLHRRRSLASRRLR